MNDKIIQAPPTIHFPIVALQGKVVDQVTDLCERSLAFMEVTAANYDLANACFSDMNKLAKVLEAERKKAKAPVLELGEQIDTAVKEVLTPLKEETLRLAGVIAIERKRQEEEATKAKAQAEAEEREAKRKLEEAAKVGDTASVIKAEQAIAQAKENKAAVVQQAQGQSHSVTVAKIKQVRIDDASKIPYQINGLQLMEPITANIKKLLVDGVTVPGCTLIEVESLRGR